MNATSNIRILFLGLWLPLLWTTLLIADIILFADGRPQNLLPRLFEDLVFVMSFLFYGIDFYKPEASQIALRYFLQFLLWWLIGIACVWAHLKSKSVKRT